MPAGRPTDYTEEVVSAAREYIDNFQEHGQSIPSVVGLCKVINRARSTVYLWAEDEDKEFSDILGQIAERQELELASKGLTGDFNATITKLMLTKHGYSDKTDNTHAGPNGGPIKTQSNVFNFTPVGGDDA